MIFVTGGAGFIGSNFILNWLNLKNEPVLNIDALFYAGNLENLKSVENNHNYKFIKGNIGDKNLIDSLFKEYQPRAVIHFAAQSHVDRSIHSPKEFIETNIFGTFQLLESARNYYENLNQNNKENFRFLHVSTDEVYGSLELNAPSFTENHQYQPNSPYSASKAASDHLVRAWFHTYHLPVLTSNCSNNYGPFQFPEKLIPLVILNALNNKKLPIYGDGKQIRDWLYVVDHCNALMAILEKGILGQTYNIGGESEKTNLEIVENICSILDELKPKETSYKNQIQFITDRPGHDRRYAMNINKIKKELNWKPQENLKSGLNKTIRWYLNNNEWIHNVQNGNYREWVQKHYDSN